MKIIVLIALLIASLTSSGQIESWLTPAQLTEDFQVFKASVSKIHGGLYWYNDSSQIQLGFDEIEAELNEPMPPQKFYSLLQKCYASLGCGHSWMSMPKSWRNQLDAQYRFPFHLYFEAERIIIANDMTPSQKLNIGWELDSIDGAPAMDVYRDLWQYAPSDGFNQTRRAETIARNFDRYYQTFKELNNEIEIVLTNPKTKERIKYNVSTISKASRDSLYAARKKEVKHTTEPLEMEFAADQAYLRISGFNPWETKVKSKGYKQFLKQNFKLLKAQNTQKLIVDLRGNGGGKDR